METQSLKQGIGYEPLRLRNESDDASSIFVSDGSISVGGSMIASFAVSTIEDMVDLFYRRPEELSYHEFSTILGRSMTGAVHDGAKTGFSSILKEALKVETLGEVAIDFTSGFFYDYSRNAYKHYTGKIDADQLIGATTRSALDNILGSLTGAAWGYGRELCGRIIGLGATIGSALATPAGVIMGSFFCTGMTALMRTAIVNNAKKDAYERIEDSLGIFYSRLQEESTIVVPLQIIDDISDFKGTSGFSLKGLVPMYNVISDYEEYKYRKNTLVNMEKSFVRHRAEWDYRTYQMKQAMLDMQKSRVDQLEIKYCTAMEQIKREFELKVRYGIEEQYRQYLAAARYVDGAITVERVELRKAEKEYRTLASEIRQKREVNQKMIGFLKSMDISDKSISDEVKKTVETIIGQLDEDSFIAAVNAEVIVPLLR